MGIPVYWWGGILIGWYLLFAGIRTFAGLQMGTAGIVLACVYSAVAVMTGFMALGPLPMIPLVIITFMAWMRALRQRSEDLTSRSLKALKVLKLSGVGVIALLMISSTMHVAERKHMRTADWVNRWSGTGIVRILINRLDKQGPSGVDELRDVLVRCTKWETGTAAQVLAKCGQPRRDVPLMISAMRRLDAGGISTYWTMHQALVAATGLNLPEKTTADEWQQQWSNVVTTSDTLTSRVAFVRRDTLITVSPLISLAPRPVSLGCAHRVCAIDGSLERSRNGDVASPNHSRTTQVHCGKGRSSCGADFA
jgi:hypothetical protein